MNNKIIDETRIDKFFLKNPFQVHSKKLKKYCESFDWINEGESLFIFGGPGTHKTGQVTAIAKKYLIDTGCKVRYYRATEIVYQHDMEKIMNCDLIIIDNLGFDPDFENKRGCLFDLIDYRLHNFKSTIVITNENIKGKFNLAFVDRFKMFNKIKIDGSSKRKKIKDKE